MQALVYHGPGRKAWEEVSKPLLVDDTDAIVRVDTFARAADTGALKVVLTP